MRGENEYLEFSNQESSQCGSPLIHVKDQKLNAKAINESQSQMLVVLLKRIYDRNDS